MASASAAQNLSLHLGDCLEIMKEIPDGLVDMVLADLPYGTTACKWDAVIPFSPLWGEYLRVTKPNAAIVLFGSQPFTSSLILSQPKLFRYCWVWDKKRGTNFQHANKMPMKSHEDIAVFYRALPTYNPQMRSGTPYKTTAGMRSGKVTAIAKELSEKQRRDIETIGRTYDAAFFRSATVNEGKRFPTTILSFSKDGKLHPTQKPVALLQYLIETYTNVGDLVLDNVMGSGSTGVAALTANRGFIGIEKDAGIFEIAVSRLASLEKLNNAS